MQSQNEILYSKVLRPSPEEFVDFAEFVENLDLDQSMQSYGLVKIIPPSKWKARKSNIEFENYSVNAPIEQNIQGKSGIYELLLIQKKSMKLNDYKKKVECFDLLTGTKSVEEVEDMFWKNLTFSPPLYGADMAGSMFEEGIPWDLNNLPGVLKEGLKNPIAGINNPYLYVGSWKTMFGWHKEDLDLYSINYLHYGKPKFWYCLSTSEGEKLEKFAKIHFPEGFSKCKEFLRHKTIMIHPYLLKQKIPDLKIHKMIQNPGEFIVTMGGAYHAGFNWGFNIAEAVNFATPNWLEMLATANSCNCVHDSVKIGKLSFYENILSSPIYGKIPSIRKFCLENGAIKSKSHISHSDQDEIESTETTDSRESNKRTRLRSTRTTKGGLNRERKVFEQLTQTFRSKKGKSANRNHKNNNDEKEDKPQQRISGRSKKIKKLGEEFDTSDWKKGQHIKRVQISHQKNSGTKKRQLKKEKKVVDVAQNYDVIPLETGN